MKFKAVIFDLDGVLIDSEPMELNRHREYLNYLKVDIPDKVLVDFAGAHSHEVFETIQTYLDTEETEVEYYEKFDAQCGNLNMDYREIMLPNVINVLKWLYKNQYSIAVASSSTMEKIEYVLNQLDIKKYFNVIVSGDMFKQSKPNPEIYLYVLKKLGMHPNEAVVVEDSDIGIEASKAADIYTVARKETRFNFTQIKADKIINDLNELIDIF